MGQQVLVAIDGSDRSERALEYALEQFPDSAITALYVVNPTEGTYADEYSNPQLLDIIRERGAAVLAEAEETAADHGLEIDTELREGRPARTIVSVAEEAGVDQVVVGSRGRTGLSRMLLGSVAEYVVRHSPTSVTVVR